MAHVDTGRSLPELLGSLATDISNLFRKEIQLAKAEASEKVDIILGATQKLAIGAVLGIAAAGVLLAAIVTGLAAIFVGMGMDPTLAHSLSAIIVAVVFGGIAWMLISGAISAMRAEKLNMDRTVHSLARDAQVVTEKF
ncbi:MAG TPA: phage holin family protein [Sphingomicrobium sp.]|jgi:AcrR family transcriptional regulator|nr:phage holin family protein [Sphingomicrobium sp.]